jgi:3-keto-disaccharide hydrolase
MPRIGRPPGGARTRNRPRTAGRARSARLMRSAARIRPAGRAARFVAAAAALGLAAAVLTASPHALADGTGNLLYTPTSSNEANAYARVIQLQHAGADNGMLIGTFEHWYTDGTPSEYIIKASKDGGTSWSTLSTVHDTLTGAGHPVSQMWQPFLFEFPRKLGAYPAGTIMLVGNTVPADGSYTEFQEWLSFDHGQTWKSMGAIQQGGTFGDGIWEPQVHLDTQGQLVMEFSDERDNSAHSQMIAQMVSGNGGASWSKSYPVVASSVQPDRPGMANVTRIGPHGGYVMSYEVCGQPNCAAHLKFSKDGLHWGNPADIGSWLETPEGYYLGNSPNITWVPNGSPKGELVMAAQQIWDAVNSQPAPIDYRGVFVNTDGGKGPWNWAPAPWHISTSSSACNADYSPDLLPVGTDGMIMYTAPTSVPGSSACGEATGTADLGVLPYHSNFASTGQEGWDMFGGTWSASNGVLSETSGGTGGNKAITGSSGWRDYQLSAQVEATSAGSVDGVAVRVSDASTGADSYRGYLVFFDSSAGDFVIAKENYSYEPLATVNVPGGVAANTWYQITVKAVGSHISATLASAGGAPVAQLSTTDPYNSFPQGMIGLRDFSGTASWQDISVTPLP